MGKILGNKVKEAFFAVLPVTVIVLLINFYIPFSLNALLSFLMGAFFLVLGISLYSLGCNLSIEDIGAKISAGTVWVVLLVGFIVGLAVTVAEPDLSVLASQVPSVNGTVLIVTIGIGVGLFALVGILRIVLKISIRYVFFAFYCLIFLLAFLVSFTVSDEFIPLAFDSGGVTTGPITVPFLMAFSVGISNVLGTSRSEEDGFGLIGICSIGPVLSVLVLGLISKAEGSYEPVVITNFSSFGEVISCYLSNFPKYFEEVGVALTPILLLLIVYQIFVLKLPKKTFGKMIVGLFYTYLGLSVFLTGANVGFMQAGLFIGKNLSLKNRYLLIPIAAAVGACIIYAEPAVRELTKQVSDITDGMLKRSTLFIVLIISMAIAVSLALLRIVFGINVWYILAPTYFISLMLMFFVPKVFTGVAFDSGGVASGPLTVAFLLPLGIGAADMLEVNVMSYAFGLVAFVAMTPLVTLQILGFIYSLKVKRRKREFNKLTAELLADEGMLIDLTQVKLAYKKPAEKNRVLKGIEKIYEGGNAMISGITKIVKGKGGNKNERT